MSKVRHQNGPVQSDYLLKSIKPIGEWHMIHGIIFAFIQMQKNPENEI